VLPRWQSDYFSSDEDDDGRSAAEEEETAAEEETERAPARSAAKAAGGPEGCERRHASNSFGSTDAEQLEIARWRPLGAWAA